MLRRHEAHLGWTVFTDAVWGASGLVSTVGSSGVVKHWSTDELGTPRIGTGSTGAVVEAYSTYPYGEEIAPAGTTQPFRFTGHERDLLNTSGVADDRDYMHQRSYLALLGRFTSVDPVNGFAQNPQSWNRYAYVLGGPLKYVDPLGLDVFSEEITVVARDPGGFGFLGPSAPFWDNFLLTLNFGQNSPPPSSAGVGYASPGALEVIKAVAENTRPSSDVCGGVTWGLNFEGSLINMFTSTGGGTKGYNVQFLPGGIGIYSYGTRGASLGWSPGITATVNWAYGTGSWAGESRSAQGGADAITAGMFGPASGTILNGGGYAGLEYGLGIASPTRLSGGVTKLNFEPVAFFGRDFGCYGGAE